MSENSLIPSVESLLDLPKSLADRATRVRDEALATGREAWLTGLGAVGVLEEEGTKLVDAVAAKQHLLVERGETVERRGRARIESMRAKADVAGRRRAFAQRVETSVVAPVVGTLQRLGLPSRAEVGELSAKVDVLTRRVNALITALEQNAAAKAEDQVTQDALAD